MSVLDRALGPIGRERRERRLAQDAASHIISEVLAQHPEKVPAAPPSAPPDLRYGRVPSPPSRAGRVGDSQPMPLRNDSADIQSMVIADFERRREVGIERYGTPLQPNNGRNALLDAYEEVLDLACYLKQRLVEEGVA